MPLRWANIPLLWRWGASLLVAAAAVVALIVFVDHNNNNRQSPVSPKRFAQESHQAAVVIGQDQAPHTTHVAHAATAQAALVAGIRHEMHHRIATGNVDGPLQSVRCGRSGSRAGRIAYHCIAKAEDEGYPFLAVVTASAHRAVYCKKDFPPQLGENIPVSSSCRL